eukprot:c25126_g2_i1 orf=35-2734(-)
MAQNRQTLVLYTEDIERATTEINRYSGAITIRLSNQVFVASMLNTFNPSVLASSSPTASNNLDEDSLAMLSAWQAVEDRDLLRPILNRRISLARRGVAAVAVVMETDISSNVLPLVLAGAHSLAATYAGEALANRLTFVFKPHHVSANGIPGGDPPDVPSQVGAAPANIVPSTLMSSWPSAVSFNNKLYCFYRGLHVNARSLFYTEFDGSSWSSARQVPDVVTSEGPSAVVFNNKLYCFKQGTESRNELWYSSFDGSTWDNDLQVPNTRATAGPSAVVLNNKLYCFHQGWTNPANALWYNVFDGEKWEGDTQVPGTFLTGSPSAVVFNNLIYCFYQGAGNNRAVLMVRVLTPESGVWSEERSVSTLTPMSQGPSAVVVNEMLYCFHQGESGGGLYVNVTSDGVEWGVSRFVEDVSLCEGLATANFHDELYYIFQSGEGGEVANGEMWYRKLKLAEAARFRNGEWERSQGEPSLEELGFSAGYQGFIELANNMLVTTSSANYGYVVYVTESPLLYDSYADETRMCLQYTDPSYIHYSFAKMFSAEGTFDQRLVNSNANYPPRSLDKPSYTLAWVSDWQRVLANAILIVFRRATNITANPHLWVLFLDQRNSRWVEMEGPKMSSRAAALLGAPAPQFGPGSKLYVFYHTDANAQEMRYNVLGVTNEQQEKIWGVEKVMHGIPGTNTPSALCVGQYMHVFHTTNSTIQLGFTSLETRFNHWSASQSAFLVLSSPSAVHFLGQIYIFNKGLGTHNPNKLAVSVWDKEKLTWVQATHLNAESAHTLNGDPAAVVNGQFVYVFYVSVGPNIWWNRFDGATWSGPAQVNMAFSGVRPADAGIAAYAWNDQIHCFFTGRTAATDGRMVFYKVFNTLDFTWNDEVILPTASGVSGKPSVIRNHLLTGA